MQDELRNYVAGERARGVSDDALREELKKKGWDEAVIASALSGAATPLVVDIPSLGTLLSDSWNELLRNFWKAALIMLVPILLGFTVGVLGGLGAFLVTSLSSLGAGLLFGILALAFIAIVFFAMFVSTIMLIVEIDRGWTLSYGDALRAALPMLLPLLFVALLMSLAVLGGFMLLVVPGIVACVWFGFAQIATVVSGKRGWHALGYSRMLVTGRFLTLLWYFFAATVIVSVVSAILNLVPLVGPFLGALATPFLLIFSIRIYRSLVALKSGAEAGEGDVRAAQLFASVSVIAFALIIVIAFGAH